MTTQLLEGAEVVARSMIRSGCRFFTGYPMTPFTEVLEHMAGLLPEVDGVCVNAESELEAIGMVWGAAAAGTRAATGSTGQGLSLMQESISEAATAGIGFVVLNMARGQGDYFQATRGGGHGDYRTPVLAPADPSEVPSCVEQAFELADRWRNPVLVVGDYYLAHTWAGVDVDDEWPDPPPAPEWTLDGSTGGTGQAKLVSPLGTTKQRDGVGYDLAAHYAHVDERRRAMEDGIEPIAVRSGVERPRVLLVAYGTMGRYAETVGAELVAHGTMSRYAETVGAELVADGYDIAVVRPVTLWPFPSVDVAAAAAGADVVAVYENNGGQMIDDVRLAVLGAAPVVGLNGYRTDSSAFGISPDVTVDRLRASVLELLEGT